MGTKRAKGTKATKGEYRFKIKAYTPETMPMARLAEYLRELATVLGEPKDVHLIGVESGSTVPVLRIDYESIPKVQRRAAEVRGGDAPRDPLVAYRRLNQMLREDNARAVFQHGHRGARVLEFPGRDDAEEELANVKQLGTMDGTVIRVGGTGDEIPVLLESEGQQISGCHTKRAVAKALATLLFEPVRVEGMGSWFRNAGGEWKLKSFRIDTFEPLENAHLSAAVTKLREIPVDWDDGTYDEVKRIRQG